MITIGERTSLRGPSQELGFTGKIKKWAYALSRKLYLSPSGIKKQLKLISKVEALFRVTVGWGSPELKSVLGNLIGVLEPFAFYENVQKWIKPLNSNRIDDQKVAQIFKEIIGKQSHSEAESQNLSTDDTNHIDKNDSMSKELEDEKLVLLDLKRTLKDRYSSKDEFIDAFKARLNLERHLDSKTFQSFFNEMENRWSEIYLPAPITETLSHLCSTITGGYRTLSFMDKWKIIDLASIAAKVGSPATTALSYAGPIIGVISCVGMGAMTVHSINKLIKATERNNKSDIWRASWTLASRGGSFIAVVSSLALPVIASVGSVLVVGTSLAAVGPYLVPFAAITVLVAGVSANSLGFLAIVCQSFDLSRKRN